VAAATAAAEGEVPVMMRQVLDPLPITVSRPLVLLRLGYRSAVQVPAKTARLLDEVIAEATPLLRPRAACAVVEVRRDPGVLIVGDAIRTASRSLAERLDGCPMAVVFAATIGAALEERARALSDAGELTRSLLFDAYGSSAAIALGLAMEQAAAPLLAPLQPTRRHAPGYGDFELEAQAPLLGLLDAGSVGIALTEDTLMLPAKSISGVIGGRGEAARGGRGEAAPPERRNS
jgi:hypothetical protein